VRTPRCHEAHYASGQLNHIGLAEGDGVARFASPTSQTDFNAIYKRPPPPSRIVRGQITFGRSISCGPFGDAKRSRPYSVRRPQSEK